MSGLVSGEQRSEEFLNPKERGLVNLANWWGDRLVSEKTELIQQPFIPSLEVKHCFAGQYYTLVTHHAKNESAKKGIGC